MAKTCWMMKELELWRVIPADDESDGIQISFTFEGLGDWVEEAWHLEPKARDAFVVQRIARMKARGYAPITEEQFDEAVARRAKQVFDDADVDVEDDGSPLFIEYLKASEDGVIRVVRGTDTCEIDLHESGATIRDSKRGTTVFGIAHDHGLVVQVLQAEYCTELLEQLERDGYTQA